MAELIDSYSESNQNNFTQLGSGGYTAIAQSFTGAAGNINSCKFYLRKTGSPTGNGVAKLYAHTGTFGTDSAPTGAALATSDNFDVSALTTSFQLITFNFSTPYTMSAATKYVIVFEYTGGGGANLVEPGNVSSGGHGGNQSRYFGGWITNETVDVCFYVYKASSGPANLKSYNTNLLANIKSINTNVIANVKSLDTNV